MSSQLRHCGGQPSVVPVSGVTAAFGLASADGAAAHRIVDFFPVDAAVAASQPSDSAAPGACHSPRRRVGSTGRRSRRIGKVIDESSDRVGWWIGGVIGASLFGTANESGTNRGRQGTESGWRVDQWPPADPTQLPQFVPRGATRRGAPPEPGRAKRPEPGRDRLHDQHHRLPGRRGSNSQECHHRGACRSRQMADRIAD